MTTMYGATTYGGGVYGGSSATGLVLTNDAESGSNGAAVTAANSGGASTNAFDQINSNGTSTVTFDTSTSAHDGTSILYTSRAGTAAQAGWNAALGTQGQLWGRTYLRIPSTAAQGWLEFRSGTARSARFTIVAGGQVGMMNAAGTVVDHTTAALSVNTWYRVEFMVNPSTSAGVMEVKLFTLDSTTAIETKTVTGMVLAATVDQALFGVPPGAVDGTLHRQDDWQVNTTGYPGPVAGVSNTAPVNTVAPTLSAGTAVVGTVLTCTTGTWSGTPTPTYSYQWQDGTTGINGATSSSYTPVTADVGSTIRCKVTATNTVGSSAVYTTSTTATTAPGGSPVTYTKQNTCTGTAGSAVASGATGQGTAFDSTSSGTGGSLAYSADALRGGGTSVKATAGTAGNVVAIWNSTGALVATQTELWLRAYVKIPTTYATGGVVSLRSSTTQSLRVSINSSGFLELRDTNSNLIGAATSVAPPQNAWFRIEVHAVASATNGTVELRLYNTFDSTTPTATVGPVSGAALTASFDAAWFGQVGVTTSGQWAEFDDVGVSNVTWLGPSSSSSGGTKAPIGGWGLTATPGYVSGTTGGGGGVVNTGGTVFGVAPLAGGTNIAGITTRYNLPAAPPAARLFWAGGSGVSPAIPSHPGTRVCVSFKDNVSTSAFTSWAAGLNTGDYWTYNHEMDNNGWTSAQISAWKTQFSAYVTAGGAALAAQAAIIYTGGAFYSNSTAAEAYWIPGTTVLGVDLDGNQYNPTNAAKNPPHPYTDYTGTFANIAAFIGRHPEIKHLIIPELQCRYADDASIDSDGSIHSAWLTQVGQQASAAGAEAVFYYEYSGSRQQTFLPADIAAVRSMMLTGGTGGSTAPNGSILMGMYNSCAVSGNDGQVGPPAGAASNWTGAAGGGSTPANHAAIVNAYMTPPGKMRLRRSFNTNVPSSWSASSAATDAGAGYVSVMSMGGDPNTMSSGGYDTALTTLVNSAPSGSKLVFLHEPEDQAAAGTFTAAQWVAAQQHFYTLCKGIRADVEVGQIFGSFQWIPGTASTSTPDNWWVGSQYTDFLGCDVYFQNFAPQNAWAQATDNTGWMNWHNWAAAKGEALIVAEFGVVGRFGATTDKGATWSYTQPFPDATQASILDSSMQFAISHNYAGFSLWNSRQIAILNTGTSTWNCRDDEITPTVTGIAKPQTLAKWNGYLASNGYSGAMFSDIGPAVPGAVVPTSPGASVTPPTNTAAPVISGNPTVGSSLAASTGTWSNTPTAYTYQWKRAGVVIPGATTTPYLVVSADAGQALTVTVTASNAAGAAAATSQPVTGVAAATVPGVPTNVTATVTYA